MDHVGCIGGFSSVYINKSFLKVSRAKGKIKERSIHISQCSLMPVPDTAGRCLQVLHVYLFRY